MSKKPTKTKKTKTKNKPVLIEDMSFKDFEDLTAKFRAKQIKSIRRYSEIFQSASAAYEKLAILAETTEADIVPLVAAAGESLAERLDNIGIILLPWIAEIRSKLSRESKG